MRYWWMKKRIQQKMFDIIWKLEKQNIADYFTNHHPSWHRRKMIRIYLQQVAQSVTLLTYHYLRYTDRM